MIPMFPFSINNTLKLFTGANQDSIDEEAIKERVSEAVMQSLPSMRNVKFNAIIVLECDNEQKRTIVMNETINNHKDNSGTGPKIQFSTTVPRNTFTTISTSDSINQANVLMQPQPVFPVTAEGLQTILNLTLASMNRSNIPENAVHNGLSFIPMGLEHTNSSVKIEKSICHSSSDANLPSRKRKAEKPCRIPQDVVSDTNGLDLTLGGRYEADLKTEKYNNHGNNIAIWPSPVSMEGRPIHNGQPLILPRVKKAPQLPGHKRSSKVFNCNQCRVQFTSLNALCKHTFSDHRAFRCTFCSANFTQRSNLQRHSLKHVGFKPFICNVCSKAYYRKDHLVRHIEVSHPGSDPKSNITVKLSSSECLEFLEKMQTSKLMEMVDGNGNHLMNSAGTIDDAALDKMSPVLEIDHEIMAQSSTTEDNGSESHDKLQICVDTECANVDIPSE